MSDAPTIRSLIPMMAVLTLGSVMTILDSNVVNVALETLGRDLRLSVSEAQWVTGAYLLTLAFTVPLTGWAADRLGTKRLWIGGLVGFILGSILCGLAWSGESLIAFRVLQGAGGGILAPVGQAILVRQVRQEDLGRFIGVLTMPLVLGPVLGPVVGGLIVDHLSWRWIFLINVPIGLVILIAATRVLRRDETANAHALDVRGLALLPAGLVALVYGLSEVDAAGSVAWAPVACVLAGAGLVTAFVRHARPLGARALVDVGLFERREFRSSALVAFVFGFILFGGYFTLPLYYQVVRGMPATEAGLLLAPQGIGSMIAMPIAGRLADRFGAGWIAPFGVVLTVAGTFVFATADPGSSNATLVVGQFLRGLGFSAFMVPSYAAAYAAVDKDAVPRATSVINVINRVGGAVGSAACAVVLAAGIASAGRPGLGHMGLHELAVMDPDRRSALEGPLNAAFSHALWLQVAIAALAFVPAMMLPRGRERTAHRGADRPAQAPGRRRRRARRGRVGPSE